MWFPTAFFSGDYYPSTQATKIFAVFFLPLSTLLLGKVISDYTEVNCGAFVVLWLLLSVLLLSGGSKTSSPLELEPSPEPRTKFPGIFSTNVVYKHL